MRTHISKMPDSFTETLTMSKIDALFNFVKFLEHCERIKKKSSTVASARNSFYSPEELERYCDE